MESSIDPSISFRELFKRAISVLPSTLGRRLSNFPCLTASAAADTSLSGLSADEIVSHRAKPLMSNRTPLKPKAIERYWLMMPWLCSIGIPTTTDPERDSWAMATKRHSSGDLFRPGSPIVISAEKGRPWVASTARTLNSERFGTSPSRIGEPTIPI